MLTHQEAHSSQPVREPYPVYPPTPRLEAHVQEFRERGFTVLDGILDAVQVASAKAALDALFAAEAPFGPERGWHTATLKVSYLLPEKNPLFQTLCFDPEVLALMCLLLGQRFVLGSLNGLSMAPGGPDQPLHIDQQESVPGTVLTVNAMHLLDDFTLENGATRVVPGSQKRVWVKKGPAANFEAETVRILAPAGSLVAFDGALWHAGSANRTQRERRVLHAFFHKPWIVPQWDFSRSLSAATLAGLTPEQKQLFGFRARAKAYDFAENRIVPSGPGA